MKNMLLVLISLALAFMACTSESTDTEDTAALQTQAEAYAQQTRDAAVPEQPQATDEPPARVPTATATATVAPWVEGSIVRASYDPAAGLGAPNVHDDFSGDNPEFELDNSGGLAHGWYADGRFNITFPSRGWWTWYSGSTAVENFYVDVVVYNGDQCADRDAAGLIYRDIQVWDFTLLFGVTCGGGYFSGISGGLGATGPVCMFTDSSPTGPADLDCSLLWDHPTSPYIDPGPGAANRLGIRGVGTQITMYINGRQVDTLNLPGAFAYPGNFGLYLGTGQADHAGVSFDDLSIWFNP